MFGFGKSPALTFGQQLEVCMMSALHARVAEKNSPGLVTSPSRLEEFVKGELSRLGLKSDDMNSLVHWAMKLLYEGELVDRVVKRTMAGQGPTLSDNEVTRAHEIMKNPADVVSGLRARGLIGP